MKLSRRAVVLTPLSLMLGTAVAQEKYPAKPVTVIVPQAPGGANDAIARIVAAKLTSSWASRSSSTTAPVRAATSARRWRPRANRTATR